MPTYQYVCTDCTSDLEAVQSFSEPSLSECPTCGGKLRKRFGAVGVVFKGSGFYRNDSRSDRPGGATNLVQILPNGSSPSRVRTRGDTSILCSLRRSFWRDGCTERSTTIGTSCEQSNAMS